MLCAETLGTQRGLGAHASLSAGGRVSHSIFHSWEGVTWSSSPGAPPGPWEGFRNESMGDHGVLGSTPGSAPSSLDSRAFLEKPRAPPTQLPSGPQAHATTCPDTPNVTHLGPPESCHDPPHVAKTGQPEPAGISGEAGEKAIVHPSTCGLWVPGGSCCRLSDLNCSGSFLAQRKGL